MVTDEIIQSWKDPDRVGSRLIGHPAGEITLDEPGGNGPMGTFSLLCCTLDAVWCPWPPPTGDPIIWCSPIVE